jgi:hypothetical protein
MKKDTLDDELRDLSPRLRDLKGKGSGMQVPDGYFDAMEKSVFQRLEDSGAQRRPALRSQKSLTARLFHPRVLMAAAAVFVLTLSAWWFLRPQHAVPQPAALAMDMDDETLENYLLDNIHDFEPEQLAMLDHDEQPAAAEPAASQPVTPSGKNKPSLDDLKPEDVEDLLKDMSEEELEELL